MAAPQSHEERIADLNERRAQAIYALHEQQGGDPGDWGAVQGALWRHPEIQPFHEEMRALLAEGEEQPAAVAGAQGGQP